ncbi:MAG: Hpt domain-containing protein [Chloroflexi bacterium]|nr:Hpt domain-containing protein [Chloroflexota bacterium]
MMDDTLEIEEQLRALRETFVQGLAGEIESIETSWACFRGGAWDADGFMRLVRMVHDLVAAGGVFGFPAVSQRARALEDKLRVVAEADVPPTARQRAQITTRLAALKRAAKE